jgi:hypothetical protein
LIGVRIDTFRRWIEPAAVLLGTFVFAWVCTTPRLIGVINWDNAGYIAEMGRDVYGWSHLPWSSHLGIGQTYFLGVALAQLFGGTVIDGFRLTNGVFFAGGCLAIYRLGTTLTQSRAIAVSLVALWSTTWVNLHYHFILEDNILFLAPCAALLARCVLRVDAWRPRDSIICGAITLLAFLGSYQALPYLGTPVWAALISPGRSWRRRLADVGLILGSFVVSLGVWMVVIVATSKLTWPVLWHQVSMGPVPNFMPQSVGALFAYIFDGHSLFETLGNGVWWNLSFHAYNLPGQPPLSKWTLGLLALLFLVALFGVTTWWSLKQRKLAPHLLGATLLLLCFVTSLHRDLVDYTGLKRYDCWPLICVMLIAFYLGELVARAPRRTVVIAVTAASLAISVAQFALGVRWVGIQHAHFYAPQSWNKQPHVDAMFYGREGKSWFQYFHDLRRDHRDACQIVLSYGEVSDGSWNYDVVGSLWSELPGHLVVADDHDAAGLKRAPPREPPRWVAARGAQIQACAWVSPAAAEVMAATR